MPKRPNPFGDPYATQFKMHISQKEVDLGVNKEQNMKVVYERTLALMYGVPKDPALTNGHDMNGQPNAHHGMNGHCGVNGQLNGHPGINGQANGHSVNDHQNDINGHGATNALQHLMDRGQQMTSGHSETGPSEAMDIDMTDKQELVSGQSFLDSKCRVVNSFPNGAMQSKEAAGCHNNNISPPSSCQMCKQGRAPKSHCNFCDKLLCAHCIRKCDNCEDNFCSICTTVNYDERYEQVFCFSCTE
ncbi:uncharacterized protein [Amphiura filiformis]|uniref:uncharacterized protein isoform X2 n=1 Tax=Amphiura filiformis TaxID=82378 RepID=UPI003B21E3BC